MYYITNAMQKLSQMKLDYKLYLLETSLLHYFMCDVIL
jgi:hypothetical protein